MTEDKRNHYQVLELDRSADERAIKKAYFTLIRKFPPDKAPEEFKRIRAAYKCLSDPVARKRHDSAEEDFAEHGDEAAELLRQATAAVNAGDEALAQQHLQTVLTAQPKLHAARLMLGQSYMRLKEYQTALQSFDRLVNEQPDTAEYHMWQGIALAEMEKFELAEASMRKARELAPADVGVALSLCNLLVDRERAKDALDLITQALTAHPQWGPERVALELRRLRLKFLHGPRKEADHALQAFMEAIQAQKDPELDRYVASRLSSTAAHLFARHDCGAANVILEQCVKLHPESLVAHPFPSVVTLDPHDLPEASREWLSQQEGGARSPTLMHSPVWTALLAAVISVGAFSLTLLALFSEPEALHAWSAVGTLLGLTVTAGMGVFAVRTIRYALTSPIRWFTTVHPLYLLDVTPLRVKAYPLFNLSDVRVVRHTTNGVYTHTQVEMKFWRKRFTVSLRDEGYAAGWAQFALDCRGRALELLAEGYLDAEDGVDLIPQHFFSHGRRMPWQSTTKVRWWGGTAGGVAAAFLLLVMVHARLVDDRAWSAAVAAGTPAALLEFAQSHPGNRHAGEARALEEQRMTQSLQALERMVNPDAPGFAGLRNALMTAHAQPDRTIAVSVTTKADPVASPEEGRILLEAAKQNLGDAQAAQHIAGALNNVLIRGGVNAVGFRPGTRSVVKLELERTLSLGDALTFDGLSPVPGLRTRWWARLHGPAPMQPWETTLAWEGPDQVLVVTPRKAEDWPRNAFASMFKQDAEVLVQQVSAAWGVEGMAQVAAHPWPPERRPASPYSTVAATRSSGGRP